MSTDTIAARITIAAPVTRVFEIPADPSTHQEIDGTGWVREHIGFPPFEPSHLDHSLPNLAALA